MEGPPLSTQEPQGREQEDAPGSKEGSFDLILVGAGLQNGLIALALCERRPDLRFLLLEREPRIGGEHTWCFHEDDVPAEARSYFDPLVQYRWDGHDVLFPGSQRRLRGRYSAISSARFEKVVCDTVTASEGGELLVGAEVTEVREHSVRLRGGRELKARLVVDARGPGDDQSSGSCGFQKFLGLELRLARPSGLERPVLMDARVPQRDGFRFVYLLPLAADRVLVEDTCFSDRPELDPSRLRREVLHYAAGRGWDGAEVLREEVGVLPMAWSGGRIRARQRPLRGGYAGGWCHPATGYSIPVAIQLAECLRRWQPDSSWDRELARLGARLAAPQRFARFLNRLLFRWYAPEDRRPVFERFYRLPEATIRRFYSLDTTPSDVLRILAGRPPRGFSVRARLSAGERSHARAIH